MKNTQPSISASENHLPWLDWMRFLAAFAVMLSHLHGAVLVGWGSMASQDKSALTAGFLALCSFGQEAVLVFFVMSGMLVGGRLLERLLGGQLDIGRYAIDRFTRIYVPLLPAVVFSVAVWAGLGNSPNPWQVLGNLVQLQGVTCNRFDGNSALWSLSYEFWFYVMAGAIGAVCLGRARGRLLGLVLLCVCMALFAKLEPVYLFCWVLGALAYQCRPAASHLGVLWVGLVVIAAGLWLSSPLGIADRDSVAYRANFLLICLGFGLFAISIVNHGPGSRLMWLERLGARLASGSYTLYLVHVPVIAVYRRLRPELHRKLDMAAAGDALLCLALCLAVSWLFYHLFERRTADVRRWLHRVMAPGQAR